MIFTAPEFWAFFAVVAGLVAINARFIRSLALQNWIYLVGSYFFYAQWDWRFLSLIIISTLVDFQAGQRIHLGENRKRWLWFSLGTNLGILGFFKYFGFFVEEAAAAMRSLGVDAPSPALEIILPVGISFYTFQTLTYSIDIYRGTLQPTTSLLRFATYVAFFPQLVAGPIERASNLLPQFGKLWTFDEVRIIQGLRLILFGMLLKVVVADNLAPIVEIAFRDPSAHSGGSLALGALYFAFQIYGDFCGYSTIAIGVAMILDVRLMTNFNVPYFATSIRDFWRQWHISLSTFFRDYVFIPLGGSRSGTWKTNRNLIVTFTISGLWHGANWTFIIWGLYHGLLLVMEKFLRKENGPESLGWVRALLQGGLTFALVCVGWVIFRASSLGAAIEYLTLLFGDFGIPTGLRSGLPYVMLAIAIDLLWRHDTRLASFGPFLGEGSNVRSGVAVRWAFYFVGTWTLIFAMASRSGIQQFIYFQF